MRSLTKTLAICLVCSSCFILKSFSQSAEKIHVHLDKDIYLPGETVWFKAYLFESGKPSLSTNLYAGWYNKEGKLLQEKRYPVFTGTANGDFLVPDSMPSQVYQLRLFTKTMRQSDSNAVFVKTIPVYQLKNMPAEPAAEKKASMEVHPEGGSLVAGINNHVAFKIVYDGAAPAIMNAALTDTEGKLIDSVYFNTAGLGKLQFTPAPATKYLLKWLNTDGQLQTTILPAAEVNGAALHTEMSGKDVYYIVQKNNSIPRFNKIIFNINAGNDLLYSAIINMEKQSQVINKFPADSLPPGIVDITLTDMDGNLLQKKSIYTKNKTTAPKVTFIEKSKDPKGKNIIEININDTSLNLLSLSIADEFFYTGDKNSIADELLLNSRSSNLYNAMGDEKSTDLIVMTSALKNTIQNSIQPTDNYLSIYGYYNNSKALPDKSVLTLIANDKVYGRQIFTLIPGKEKNFSSTGLIVYDSAKLYYQLNTKELSDYISFSEISNYRQPITIKAAQPFFPGKDSKNYLTDREKALDNYLNNKPEKFNDITTLKAVEVKGKKKNAYMARMQELDDRYANNIFKGLSRGDQFNVLDDPMADGYLDVFSYLSGRVSGVTVKRSSFGGTIESNRGLGGGQPLALFIDEMSASFDMLAGLPLSQVAYIKVINGIVIGSGGSSTTGAVYVYTRKGNDIKNTTPPMRHVAIKGYDMPKEFVNPDYSEKQALLNKDYRSTLYWNPYIEIDKETQKLRVEYYNNDISKKQVLTLKGFNEEGELIEVRQILE